MWVRLGVNKFDDISTHRQQLKIVERIAHPEYKSNSHYHDIGLLKLEKPAKMNPYARPACLYLSPEISAQRSIVTGWGQTSWGGDGSSNELHKVIIDLFDREICDPFYRNQRKLKKGILNDIQVCAGSLDEEKDTCQVNNLYTKKSFLYIIYLIFYFFLYLSFVFCFLILITLK